MLRSTPFLSRVTRHRITMPCGAGQNMNSSMFSVGSGIFTVPLALDTYSKHSAATSDNWSQLQLLYNMQPSCNNLYHWHRHCGHQIFKYSQQISLDLHRRQKPISLGLERTVKQWDSAHDNFPVKQHQSIESLLLVLLMISTENFYTF